MTKIIEMYKKTDECDCPLCEKGTLDEGGECGTCNYDRQHKMNKEEFTESWLKVRGKPKHIIIEFLRNHG